MTDSKLLIVGSIGMDTIETPQEKVERVLGGAAVFSATAACQFTPTSVVGVVGDDFPAEYEKLMQDKGIDLSCVDKKPGQTFFWHGRYHEDMNQRDTLDTQLGVFGEFEPNISAEHRKIPNVFLANIHPQLQLDVLDTMEGNPFVGLDTMNLWIENTPDLLRKVIERVNLIIVNDEEAKMITGKTTVLDAADALLDMGPELAVVKKGDAGAMLFSKEQIFSTPAVPLRTAKDPTGAGDTFAGGMMGYIAHRGQPNFATFKQAAVVGTVMASFTVEDFSLNKIAHVKPEHIRERIEKILEITLFDKIDF